MDKAQANAGIAAIDEAVAAMGHDAPASHVRSYLATLAAAEPDEARAQTEADALAQSEPAEESE